MRDFFRVEVWTVTLKNADNGNVWDEDIVSSTPMAQANAEATAIKRYLPEHPSVSCVRSTFLRDATPEEARRHRNPHVRDEIFALADRGDVTLVEWTNLTANSYERELIVPKLNDEAFLSAMQYSLKNCSTGDRPFSTYDQSICGLFAPELMRRYLELIELPSGLSEEDALRNAEEATRKLNDYDRVVAEANGFAETIDNIREALGQKATHYLVIADDVKALVRAVEEQGGFARDVLSQLRNQPGSEGRELIASPELAHSYQSSPALLSLALAWAEGAAAGRHYAVAEVVEQGGSRLPCVVVNWKEPDIFRRDMTWKAGTGIALPVSVLLEQLGLPLLRCGFVMGGALPEDTVSVEHSSPYQRTPDGHINNCSLANGDEEKNCQICAGKRCPDRERYQGGLGVKP